MIQFHHLVELIAHTFEEDNYSNISFILADTSEMYNLQGKLCVAFILVIVCALNANALPYTSKY